MQKTTALPKIKEMIYIDGKDRTDEIKSYSFEGNKCIVVFNYNGKSYSYSKNKIRIVKPPAQTKSIFNYLKDIVDTIGLTTDEGNNILADSYSKITNIPKNTILSNYLNQKLPKKKTNISPIDIFPFGFNLSQKQGVDEAFSNELSIIEGPPGTGKTQTILNIIANAVMNDESIAVVSSNNSATKNVFEKLEKSGISFISALLGSVQNKKEFIDSQLEIPDISDWCLIEDEKKLHEDSNRILFKDLSEKLEFKNELALIQLDIENIEAEHKHFMSSNTNSLSTDIHLKNNMSSDKILNLWITLENNEESDVKMTFLRRLMFRIRYGVRYNKNEVSYLELISLVQSRYYDAKISELENRKSYLESVLQGFSFDKKMKEYTDVSMLLFKNKLYDKYNGKNRKKYSARDLYFKPEEFIKDYPVIMSTTYSLRRSLNDKMVYDFVIIDESSQVDITTGALALSCAKKAVVVGDLKQLPNVVDDLMAKNTDVIFENYQIPEAYRYSNHSLLSSLTELFPTISKTLLREHYRCHPQIIDFCNRKFYNNELIILSEAKTERSPLVVYKTVEGNHARNKVNQRQIDVITQEIIPQQGLENVDLGIVTPYRNQTSALQNTFIETEILADTVDKFQGRENDVIILSTVDNEISEFTDNPNRLNVAISRAKDQLILLVNGNGSEKDSNINDLIRYIDYQNFTIVDSKLRSIFDYLYKGYEEKRREILTKNEIKSVYDSENLMYILIKNILSYEEFSKYDVILNFPLRNLLLDFDKLSEEEERYAKHHSTHLDFIIYNKLGKNPVLAIEVDGYEYHKEKSRQGERDLMKNNILDKYGFTLLRFSTTGSGEKERLIEALKRAN